MYDKNFDISKMIPMIDIVIFCNIAPHLDRRWSELVSKGDLVIILAG